MLSFLRLLMDRLHTAGQYSAIASGCLVVIGLCAFFAARWIKKCAPQNARDVVTTILVSAVSFGAFKILPFGAALLVCLVLLSCHAAAILRRRGLFPYVE